MMFRHAAYRVSRRLSNGVLDFLNRTGLATPGLDYRFLAACSQGIYLYAGGTLKRLMKGHCFGMTSADRPGRFFVTEYTLDGLRDERSRIFYCNLNGDALQVIREVRFRCNGQAQWPARVHQIKWHEGNLWVANTRQNVIWKASADGDVLAEWTGTRRFDYDFENVRDLTRRVRRSPEYKHYNSIAFRDGVVHVLAHNSAGDDKSGRSFLITLDSNFNEIDCRENVGKACHDLLFHADDLYICNSGEGTLLKNFEPVLHTGRFLRGIGLVGSILILGGSAVETAATKRTHSKSQFLFVDVATNRVIHTMNLGRVGNVNDILVLDQTPTISAAAASSNGTTTATPDGCVKPACAVARN